MIPRIRTGYPALDRLLEVSSCIITFRAPNISWLSGLAVNTVVLNHEFGAITLYLHFVDYHKRYWTLDCDFISSTAKRVGRNPEKLSEELFFVRAFSRDSTEVKENWKMISEFTDSGRLDMVILDSISELHAPERRKGRRDVNQKTLSYVLGQFKRLCIKHDCFGIVLSHSSFPVHPFLGSMSSVILELDNIGCGDGITVALMKHPCLPNMVLKLHAEKTLREWM